VDDCGSVMMMMMMMMVVLSVLSVLIHSLPIFLDPEPFVGKINTLLCTEYRRKSTKEVIVTAAKSVVTQERTKDRPSKETDRIQAFYSRLA
jgi:hypothetical protein